jgi:hypothetical protein
LKSTSVFGHPFHIHDVEFKILTINGATPPTYQQGWKDVVLVEGGKTVRFIAKFDDFADAIHPFMYHCHIALHEDEGMMGQFVVTDINSVNEISKEEIPITLFPNPAHDKLFVEFKNQAQSAYYVTVKDFLGRTKLMLPNPYLKDGIDISTLSKGVYTISIMEKASKQVVTKTFIVN